MLDRYPKSYWVERMLRKLSSYISPKTDLCRLFEKHLSDKCPLISHSYSKGYYELLNDHRESFKSILEIGIGSYELMSPIAGKDYKPGASLRAWREFFPNADIYGFDINSNVLFSEDRIKCFYADQSRKESLVDAVKRAGCKFDLIIDDGSHMIEDQTLTFHTLAEYVNPNGYYIIEDVARSQINFFTFYKVPDFYIYKIHKGFYYWDGFVAYRKCAPEVYFD